MSQQNHDWTKAEIAAGSSAAQLRRLPRTGRLSLRARAQDIVAIEAAFGLSLPRRIGSRSAAGGLDILMLGPDEWQIKGPVAETSAIEAAAAAIYPDHPHSLVDISAREESFHLSGPKADILLTLGLARDIKGIPVGEGRRCFMDGLTVILRRDGAQDFTLDIWTSFAAHLWHLLETGCHELAAE